LDKDVGIVKQVSFCCAEAVNPRKNKQAKRNSLIFFFSKIRINQLHTQQGTIFAPLIYVL
jgi:hypothetical protein